MGRVHTKQTSADLRTSAALAPLVKKGDVAVVSAYFSLDTGRVPSRGWAGLVRACRPPGRPAALRSSPPRVSLGPAPKP
ncbi:hypothetical protein ACWD26_01265 [Streptomyces sp. NPDC002787]